MVLNLREIFRFTMAKHALRGSPTIARAYCVCGWSYRAEKLRGKTDEELIIEAGKEFDKHKASFNTK